MFRPIAAVFRLLQFCSKSIIYMPILRGDAEISSSLRVKIILFSGKSNVFVVSWLIFTAQLVSPKFVSNSVLNIAVTVTRIFRLVRRYSWGIRSYGIWRSVTCLMPEVSRLLRCLETSGIVQPVTRRRIAEERIPRRYWVETRRSCNFSSPV